MVIGEFVYNPVDQLRQEFAFDRPTGFADGRQHGPSPLLRTALVERAHQQTVRCADEIHVAGLPLAVAHLAIAESQLLLAVPMTTLPLGAVEPIGASKKDGERAKNMFALGLLSWMYGRAVDTSGRFMRTETLRLIPHDAAIWGK